MLLLDRVLQYRILKALEEVYPDSVLVSALPFYEESRAFMANLFYLREHGFLVGGDVREPGRYRSMVDIQITKDGLDFLASDGGVATILDGARLSIETSDIMTLFQRAAAASVRSDEEKKKFLLRLEALSMTELQDMLMLLLEEGLVRCGDEGWVRIERNFAVLGKREDENPME